MDIFKRDILNRYRIKTGQFASKNDDNFGMFLIPQVKYSTGPKIKVICSPFDRKEGWRHVSVSLPNRCPTWHEMSLIKDLFWSRDITVVQFHPKEENYVNNHKYCLHLWEKIGHEYELPPTILTGIK
jgi:hypothetical protein